MLVFGRERKQVFAEVGHPRVPEEGGRDRLRSSGRSERCPGVRKAIDKDMQSITLGVGCRYGKTHGAFPVHTHISGCPQRRQAG